MRRRINRHAIFCNSRESLWRRLHRWIAVVAAVRGEPVKSVQIVRRDGVQKGLVTVAGAHPRVLAFDMAGRGVADWATAGVEHGNGYYADWHQIVKRMHRGDIVGHFQGRYFSIGSHNCQSLPGAQNSSLATHLAYTVTPVWHAGNRMNWRGRSP